MIVGIDEEVTFTVQFTSDKTGLSPTYSIVNADTTIIVAPTNTGVVEVNGGTYYVEVDLVSPTYTDFTGYIIWDSADTKKEYAIEELMVTDTDVSVIASNVVTIKNILEGDVKVDTTTTPWDVVVYTKGTSTELIRKKLKDVNGADVTNIGTFLGQQVDS